MELNGVRLPSWYNGVGLHDSVGCYTATMNYNDAKAHAEDIKAHGCAGPYKLFVSGGNKVERAKGYVDSGILPIIRDWVDRPWGRPPASWVMPVDQIRMYADVGVQLFEIAGNEINISAEWQGDMAIARAMEAGLAKQSSIIRAMPNAGMPHDPAILAKAAVDAFEVALNNCAQVGNVYPLLTSCTPGGSVDHRLVYPAIVTELNNRHLMGNVKHAAIHNRPHNNPPETKWSATNTVTFDEYRWIRDQFPDGIYYWATEHGYSLNDDQNHTYPKIDLNLHTEYNWTLQLWMEEVIEPELAGFSHWFEAGWGAWGAWPKDALRDSIVPEMPAPSPLWIRMGEQVHELEFNRYDIPPVVDYAKGFDCSSYQGDINWDAVSEDFAFVFVRASAGLTADEKYAQNFDTAGEHGLLRGAYHYLRQELGGQAKFFYDTCGARIPELGYYMDLEQAELTADKCQLALETTDTWTKQTTGIYTRASFFDKFGSPAWAQGRKLWVAHWGVDNPTLPQAWENWEFWQTGQGTIAGQTMDLDCYNGDEIALYDNYGPEEPPMEGPKIYDASGTEQTWEWLHGKYGTGVTIQTPIAESYWAVAEIHEITNGSNVCFIESEPGTKVIWNWPDAPAIPAGYNTEWGTKGDVAVTDANWSANFGMWTGSYYDPATQKKGPHNVWCGASEEHSEQMIGIGMLMATNHWHLDLTWFWHEGTEPPPPDDWEADTTARLERIEQKVDFLIANCCPGIN